MTHQPANWQHDHQFKGVLLLIAGILLLLYALNILTTGITIVFIIVSVGLIVVGTMLSGLDKIVKDFVHKLRNKNK